MRDRLDRARLNLSITLRGQGGALWIDGAIRDKGGIRFKALPCRQRQMFSLRRWKIENGFFKLCCGAHEPSLSRSVSEA